MNKQEIKSWLKAIGKDRFWLAEQLLCKKRTVDAWLSSSANIPIKGSRVVSRLMAQYPATGNTPETSPSAADNAITLTVDDATFDAWNKAATAEGKLLRQWCVDVINESLE
ncbi:hypothetical protein CXU19_11200 [Akkermansia muciniphila]|nr:hypothetical protein CXU19_11200 [Akkermansia muciniphila]PNC37696.1 hypothetical protein CXU20_11385 [Akkermansia muciniphila]